MQAGNGRAGKSWSSLSALSGPAALIDRSWSALPEENLPREGKQGKPMSKGWGGGGIAAWPCLAGRDGVIMAVLPKRPGRLTLVSSLRNLFSVGSDDQGDASVGSTQATLTRGR
ncbi:hypothetical protein F4776DRAFT_662183 [Hypoxylon sp. NC0597]|nr:hypothetical protein F4776DRAFT_662183 [Hypoxylon sp. NC0597]